MRGDPQIPKWLKVEIGESPLDYLMKSAEEILSLIGYNYALSDTQHSCKVLGHPELKESDTSNYHKWAEPFTRRCYCGAVGYTDEGRFYAVKSSHPSMMKQLFPGWRERFGERAVDEE